MENGHRRERLAADNPGVSRRQEPARGAFARGGGALACRGGGGLPRGGGTSAAKGRRRLRLPRRRPGQLEQRLGGASDRRRGLPPCRCLSRGSWNWASEPTASHAAQRWFRCSGGGGRLVARLRARRRRRCTGGGRRHLRRRPPPYALPLSTPHPTGAAAVAPVPRENKLFLV